MKIRNIVKKIVSVILVVVLLVVSTDINVLSSDFKEISEDIVYVDGNEIRVSINTEEGYVKAESTSSQDDSYIIIYEDSGSVINVFDENEMDYVEYDLEIKSLTNEDIDITIYDDNGELYDRFDDINDLFKDSYVTQAAVAVVVGITAETLITAILEAAACIVVASCIFYGAKAAVETIKSSKETRSYYYKAYIYEKNVFINLNNITYNSAVSRIINKRSIYTYTSSMAKSVVLATGLGCTSSEISDLKGKVRFYHYHTANRNGAHAFYGLPHVY